MSEVVESIATPSAEPTSNEAALPSATPVGGEASPTPAPSDEPAGETPTPAPSEPTPFYQAAPENWRNEIVSGLGLEGEEATKRLNQLGRISDLPSAFKKMFSAEDKIREGMATNKLADDATEEQVTEWRKANDVPLEATAYEIDLGEGVTLNDADKGMLGKIQEAAHEMNVSNGAMNAIANKFFEERAADVERISKQDEVNGLDTEKGLKQVWASDFDRNVNILGSALNAMPEGLSDALHTMRDANGKALVHNPTFLNWMLEKELLANPTATIAPSGGSGGAKGLSDRKAEIEKVMAESPDSYYKDNAMQKEYRSLLEAEDRLQAQNR
jgi:hypothetical protein